MDSCEDSLCVSYTFPNFLPPPPLPSFLIDDVEAFLNQSRGHAGESGGSGVVVDGETTCDLCSWAGYGPAGYGEASDNPLPLSSLLVIVAVVSALCGAGLTSFVIMIRRLRNRKFEGGSGSVRHLSRKMNESSRPTPSSSSFTSNVLTENTYCEGPYNESKEASPNNIYAELHTGIPTGIWTRPPIPAPVQNCYLELKDIPNRCTRCLPAVPQSPHHHWQTSEASPSSSYYSDLDLGRNSHSAQPV